MKCDNNSRARADEMPSSSNNEEFTQRNHNRPRRCGAPKSLGQSFQTFTTKPKLCKHVTTAAALLGLPGAGGHAKPSNANVDE